jgi:endonuclease/exonuclease/phosphatase family metal-dependent hydrolase
MSRNLYLGAEIQSLAAITDPESFFLGLQAALMQVALNNFPDRAVSLGAEIADYNPKLVGLQEVYDFTIDGYNGPPPFRNYLDDLLAVLGASYYVAAVVENLAINVPVPGVGTVGVLDRDVILARHDVVATPVDLTEYCSKPLSEDGCNYLVVAGVNTPIGPIAFERGYVCVDAMIGKLPVRFCNTHLEVREPDPTNPLSPFIQRLQAFELVNTLNSFPEDKLIIVVGDINSSPEDLPIIGLESPYMQLAEDNSDVWELKRNSQHNNPEGLTCCQAENLLNPESELYERIDVIFSSKFPRKVKAYVVGDEPADKTSTGLWPSDHAGVVARMKFRSHFHKPWWHYHNWFFKSFDH